MRGSRVAELAERLSPRGLRTPNTNSDPLQFRPRPALPCSLPNRKKLGTRIANLESQLGLAQEELQCLKDQLASTDVAKKAARDQLLEKVDDHVEVDEKEKPFFTAVQPDALGAPVEAVTIESKNAEPELGSKSSQTCVLETRIQEKEKQVASFRLQNESLKSQLEEKTAEMSSAQTEIDQLKSRLNEALQVLEKSRDNESQILERMEVLERSNEDMDSELRKLALQTEQWRKAAEAAAAVFSDVDCTRMTERCGSMDAHNVRFGGFAGLPATVDDHRHVFGSEKRKGASGVRMLGELWKRGHK